MGCDNSKEQDINQAKRAAPRPQRRAAAAGSAKPGAQQKSPADRSAREDPGQSRPVDSQPAGVPRSSALSSVAVPSKEVPDDIMLSASYSERREEENEKYFLNLIDNTVKNLIDISQDVNPLEGIDIVERSRSYNENVERSGPVPQQALKLFALPTPALSNNESALFSGTLEEDSDLVTRLSQQFASEVRRFEIHHAHEMVVAFG